MTPLLFSSLLFLASANVLLLAIVTRCSRETRHTAACCTAASLVTFATMLLTR